MQEFIAKQLQERSAELHFSWCEIPRREVSKFLTREWVLVVDDRFKGRRFAGAISPRLFAKAVFPIGKPMGYIRARKD